MVTARILAVVSCKLNKVLPQDGQEIYSVLEILERVACRIPKDVESIVLKDIILKKEEVEKYKDKEGVLLNAEEVFLLVNDVLDNINNKKFSTLVSSNFN